MRTVWTIGSGPPQKADEMRCPGGIAGRERPLGAKGLRAGAAAGLRQVPAEAV